MKKICLSFVVNAISLYVVSLLMDSMYIGSFKSLITLAVIFCLLNVFVKPILKFFTLPIRLLTLGLFSLVINGVVIKIAFELISGVSLNGFIDAIVAAVLVSVSNCILNNILD